MKKPKGFPWNIEVITTEKLAVTPIILMGFLRLLTSQKSEVTRFMVPKDNILKNIWGLSNLWLSRLTTNWKITAEKIGTKVILNTHSRTGLGSNQNL
jgi:hypothetical protein